MRTLLVCFCVSVVASPALAGDAPTATASAPKPVPVELTVAKAVPAMPNAGQPFSVEMHMTSNGEEVVMKRTVDGPKTRMDITAKGMSQTMIMLGDEAKTTYMIDPKGKRAMKMSVQSQMDKLQAHEPTPSAAASTPTAPPQGVPKLVGQETIDGHVTDKYEVDYGAQGKGTMWIDPEKNLPVRMEGQGNTIDFKNYQFGAQPADAFEVPKGYAVTDMDEMMKKMPAGAAGGMAQAMAGSMGGGLGSSFGGGLGASLGGMLGGPLGSMVGQYVGSKIGQKIGSTVGEKAASAVVH
jgi:outer membrane lipoprotein-sorting protein